MQKQTRTYVEYTNRRVNQIKKGLRAGTPRLELATSLSREWDVRVNPVYQKIHKVAAEMKAYKAKQKLERPNIDFISHVDRGRKESTINLTKNTKGIELSGDALRVYNKLKKEPTKIVLYDDHVRYYF
jgi:hypothetical protein